MASNDPTGHSGSSGPPEDPEDALGRLEQRLDAASEAAERLLADAAARVSRTPPPSGWQQAEPEGDDRRDGLGGLFGSDAHLLLGLLASVRDRIPPELQQRLAEAVREVLLALRALIDWYLERTDRRGPQATEVQDIPIL
ncbi:MAG TPA: hypothetical protein VG325_01410 [Solirubrobacteraceae bacterium]|jgi:hypothetical protein|nr:hypothetical protein [Solirubrobacteraceae bacterium]